MIKELLKQHEGFSNKSYKDTKGIWTIGYGRNLQSMTISRELAEQWLDEDIKTATEALKNKLPFFASLDEVRQAVLINMSFNMGISRLLGFIDTLALIKNKRYVEASKEMLDSKWAKFDVGMKPGQRAYVLSQMMRTGEWQK